MQEPKKDDSVKTGLEIAAQKVTKSTAEKDAAKDIEIDPDDLVHEQHDIPEDIAGKDPDDLVHSLPSEPVADDMTEKDPDDLVHDKGIDEVEEG